MHTSGNGGQAKPNHASTPYCRGAAIHSKGGNKNAPLQHVHCHIPGTRLIPPFILHKVCPLPTQSPTSVPKTPCSQSPPPQETPATNMSGPRHHHPNVQPASKQERHCFEHINVTCWQRVTPQRLAPAHPRNFCPDHAQPHPCMPGSLINPPC